MGARRSDQFWLFSGISVIALLVVGGYLLLIGPKYAAAADVQARTADTEMQVSTLRRNVANLQKQEAKLPEFRASLSAAQAALPSEARVSDFLRQLQRAGDSVNVTVSQINVATPVKATSGTEVWQLPITLGAEGSAANLSSFLRQLQQVQPRAVLVQSANLTMVDKAKPALSLNIVAFVTRPAATGAAILTTGK